MHHIRIGPVKLGANEIRSRSSNQPWYTWCQRRQCMAGLVVIVFFQLVAQVARLALVFFPTIQGVSLMKDRSPRERRVGVNTTHLCSAQHATLAACTLCGQRCPQSCHRSFACLAKNIIHRLVRHVHSVVILDTDFDAAARRSNCTSSSTTTTSRTRVTKSTTCAPHFARWRTSWSLGRRIPTHSARGEENGSGSKKREEKRREEKRREEKREEKRSEVS